MADDLATLRWRKSSRSGGGNQCVEVAVTDDAVFLRDTKNRSSGHLVATEKEWQSAKALEHKGCGARAAAYSKRVRAELLPGRRKATLGHGCHRVFAGRF